MSLPLSVPVKPAGDPREEGNLREQEEQEHPEERRQHQLVWEFLEFFTPHTPGFFAEVGANHPWRGSQTWHLEQRGWRGILVEPLPEHADRLRRTRTAAVFAVACSSPENAGQMLPFFAADALSGLDRSQMAPWAEPQVINVPVRTLDSILERAGAPQPIDFLSIDVEGHEIEVLRGFDFARWAPRLILLEDHIANLNRHRFMTKNGYRLVRRTGLNGWYVPETAPIRFGLEDNWHLLRKYYLGMPLRKMRHRWRALFYGRAYQRHSPH
jgi:FkbM family methyltransferase